MLSRLPRTAPLPIGKPPTTLTQGACLNGAIIKLVESLVRLLPSATEEGGQDPAPAPTADGTEGVEGLERGKEDYTRKETYDSNKVGEAERHHGPRQPKRPPEEPTEGGAADHKKDKNMEGKEGGRGSRNDPLPSQAKTATAHVEFWDKLR